MKKPIVISILLGLFFANAVAQNYLPPPYKIKSDSVVNLKLDDAYWQMLEDKEGKLTIDHVSKPSLADKFHYNTTQTNSIDYSIRTYWLRFRFQNDMTHVVKIGVWTGAAYSDYYTVGSNGKWDHQLTGMCVPWSKRDGLKRLMEVTYTVLPAEELMVYVRYQLRMAVRDPQVLRIHCNVGDKAIQKDIELGDSHLTSFLLGFIFLAALFNLYFFLITRERIYLLFSLMLLFRSISMADYTDVVLFPEHPILRYYLLIPVSMGGYFFFKIHFVRYFLETFKHVPRWDKFLVSLSFISILFNSLSSMEIIRSRYIYYGQGAINLFILISFISALRSVNRSTRWTIAAILPAIFIVSTPFFYGVFSTLEKYTGIPIPGWVTWLNNQIGPSTWVSLIWLLIILSWGLFRRYHQLQEQIAEEKFEKERLEKEKETQRSQLLAQRSELEMQALRAQMNPHFIFNCLNSINRFILKKQSSEATEYLTKFSRLIRMILNSSTNTSVSLAEDLEALQLYLELESLRFEKKFCYKIECDPEIDTELIQVPPMLLQPFVENAIWHGLMNKEGEGHVWVNINQEDSSLICTITDDGIGRKRAAALEERSGKHKSMGMKITESRIAMMQKMDGENKSVEVRDLVDADGSAAGTEVVLKIPVI